MATGNGSSAGTASLLAVLLLQVSCLLSPASARASITHASITPPQLGAFPFPWPTGVSTASHVPNITETTTIAIQNLDLPISAITYTVVAYLPGPGEVVDRASTLAPAFLKPWIESFRPVSGILSSLSPATFVSNIWPHLTQTAQSLPTLVGQNPGVVAICNASPLKILPRFSPKCLE